MTLNERRNLRWEPDEMTDAAERQWIHRATWSDGQVKDTEPRTEKPDQPCFAGFNQSMMRRLGYPGITVVHLVRERPDGEWRDRRG